MRRLHSRFDESWRLECPLEEEISVSVAVRAEAIASLWAKSPLKHTPTLSLVTPICSSHSAAS